MSGPLAEVTRARRSSLVPSEVLPKRRDSSIGATSANPRLRRQSVLEVAAAMQANNKVNFNTLESINAMNKLKKLLLPLVQKRVYRLRRQRKWKVYPPRTYSESSVVSGITSSKSIMASWPAMLLMVLAKNAEYMYYLPNEIAIYKNETHLSTGVVVLLRGTLTEDRGKTGAKEVGSRGRPVQSHGARQRYSPDVLCDTAVLCEDRSLTRLVAGSDGADVALIHSRLLWEVFQTYVMESAEALPLLSAFRERILPQRVDMLHTTYFPTSVVLQRSWMWPYFSGSDRVKLARGMDVQVLGIGDVLYEEGDYDHHIYFVRRGSLTLLVKGEPLAMVEPGASFGEISVLFGDRRNSSVVAATVCELYTLHRKELFHRFSKYPELANKIYARAIELRRMWMSTGRLRDIFGLVSLLSGVPFLTHTTDSMREEIAKTAEIVTVPAGFPIARKYTPCTNLYVLGRGTVRVGGALNPNDPLSCLPAVGEARGAGDFLGEHCLQPHLYPLDIYAETSADMWVMDREKILEILQRHSAEVQALESCKLGIQLYKAQRGENSVVEGFEMKIPKPPTDQKESSKKGAKKKSGKNGAAAAAAKDGGDTADATADPEAALAEKNAADAELPNYDWVAYGLNFSTRNSEERPRGSLNSALLPAASTGRELLPVDKESEKAMKKKVQELISYPVDTVPNAADADFPGPVSELQCIIVEQLLLTATEDQPRFLRQVNSSNVKLITDSESVDDPAGDSNPRLSGGGGGGLPGSGGSGAGVREGRLGSANPANVGGIMSPPCDDAEFSPALDVCEVPGLQPIEVLDPDALAASPTPVSHGDDRSSTGLLADDPTPMNWSQTFGRPSKPMPGLSSPPESAATPLSITPPALPGMSTVSQLAQAPHARRGSVNRQQLMRPGSAQAMGSAILPAPLPSADHGPPASAPGGGTGISSTANYPRRLSTRRPSSGVAAGVNIMNELGLISPRASSALRPGSGSDPTGSGGSGAGRLARPTSVDYSSQRRMSTAADRSASVLDRLVRIEDQNYFSGFVTMQPLQQEEVWTPPEELETPGNVPGSGPLLLLLMHVSGCQYLPADVMEGCTRPFVKVMVGKRVLLRTPVMEEREAPRWTMEQSSFISFIRRGADLQFFVCELKDYEDVTVFSCTLQTTDFKDSNGVGTCSLKLHQTDPSASTASKRAHEPRVNVTMLAVTASKYKVLQRQLDNKADAEEDARRQRAKDESKVYLQIVGVAGLEHRIEASVRLTLLADANDPDGGDTVVLHTPRLEHKTRTPSWRGDSAFAVIEGEGRRLKMELLHKDAVVGSCETTLDDLIFNGMHVQRFPVALPQSPSEVIGEVLVNVLHAHISNEDEGGEKNRVSLLSIEEINIGRQEDYEMSPDPFVVVRDADNRVVLRTPLAYGTFHALFSAVEASSMLACTTIAESTDTYFLEVYDSDESTPIGKAQLSMGVKGLKPPGVLYEIPLAPRGSGTVRLSCPAVPLRELPKAKTFEHVAATDHLSKDSPILFVHIAGAHELPGSEMGLFRTDPLACLTLGDVTYITTPKQSGTTDPIWHVSRASVMLRLRPQFMDEVACLRVYDGLRDEVDEIGVAQLSLRTLCQTRTHTLTLRHGDRDVGSIVVHTYCGKVGRMLFSPGDPIFGDGDDNGAGDALTQPKELPPLPRPLAETHPGLRCPAAKISLTNLCNVLPKAAYKEISIAISDPDKNKILTVDREPAETPNAVWEADGAAALVDLRQLYEKKLTVKVKALAKESAEAATTEKAAEIGRAVIPFDVYSRVGPDEVVVRTVELLPKDKKAAQAAKSSKEPLTLSFSVLGVAK